MHRDIARFDIFAGLNRNKLNLIARHSRRVTMPAGRWLLRPGRSLRGHHFLLSGSVVTLDPDQVVKAGQGLARRALYPGVAGLRTLTECELLQVSDTVLELFEPLRDKHLMLVGEADDCWQARFLGSELMARLSPVVWQSVLKRLAPQSYGAGDLVVVEGDHDVSRCFILTSGTARVERAGKVVATIEPGGLFGEDALITREPRNASVWMVAAGVAMSLKATDFRQFLVDVLLQGAYQVPSVRSRNRSNRVLVRLGSSRDLRERIERLDPSVEYLVSSAQEEVEALAIFLMRKQGLKAWAAPAG